MPEYQPVSSAHIAAIERPRCPNCQQNRMLLSKLEQGPTGFDHHSFECQKCGRVQTTVDRARPDDLGRRGLACQRAQAADVTSTLARNAFWSCCAGFVDRPTLECPENPGGLRFGGILVGREFLSLFCSVSGPSYHSRLLFKSLTEHNGIMIVVSPRRPRLLPVTESVALPPAGPAPCSTAPEIRASQGDFDPKAFLGRAGAGKGHRAIREKPEDLQPGRRRRHRLFHPQGQGQDHGLVRARQGSGGRAFRGGAVLRRGRSRGGGGTHHHQPCHGRLPDHVDHQARHARGARRRSRSLRRSSSPICCPATAGSKTT